MALIRLYNKNTGITYVYESKSYYDPEKKQSRSKRKLVGRLDPETGEIIPTGKPGRPSKNTPADPVEDEYRKLYLETKKQLAEAEARIISLQADLDEMSKQNMRYKGRLDELADLCGKPLC